MKIIKKLLLTVTLVCLITSIFACDLPANSSTPNHQQDSSSFQEPDEGAETYQISLTQSNTPISVDENVTSFAENEVNDVIFEYTNAYSCDDSVSHVNLSKGGSITNATPIGDLRTVTINYDFINAEDPAQQNLFGFGYLKYRVSNNYVDNPNDYGTYVTSVGSDYVIDLSEYAGDYFISFWTPREIEINSLTFEYAPDEYYEVKSDFTIQLFSTNDLHGQVTKTDKYPGLSSLTNKMQTLASEGDQYNIFIDQGDIYQGTAEAGFSNGLIMDDFLLINGYEATTLGNHEFDWGESRIIEHVNYSPVTILANNIVYKDTKLSPEWATPYKLISRNGVKIGIIGAVGDVRSSISASKIENIDFLTGDDLSNQIIKDSTALKEMGADFIILSLHDGDSKKNNGASYLSYYDVAKLSKTHVDLVLEGHSHQGYSFYDYKGVWHLQNGGNGSTFYLSKLKCTYDENGEVSVSVSTTDDLPYYYYSSSASEDQLMSQVNDWYEEYVYGKLQGEVVGKNVPYMDSSNFEDLVAKLCYEYGMQKTAGTKYEIVLGGGFIRTRTPYDLAGGTVKYGDLYNLLPFDNDLVLCSITGSYLKSRFLNTTNSDYHIYTKITSSQVSNNATYYILTDSYTSDYASNRLTVVQNYTITDFKYSRDLVSDYFKSTYLN